MIIKYFFTFIKSFIRIWYPAVKISQDDTQCAITTHKAYSFAIRQTTEMIQFVIEIRTSHNMEHVFKIKYIISIIV